MAWPTGVTLRTCSLGPDFGIVSGDDYGCDIVVSVSRPMMTWGATGSGGIGDQDSLSFIPGQEVTFQLPVTDQAGWYIGGLPIDVSDGQQSHVYTLTIKPWIYNSLGRKTFSNATLTLSNLAVPTGDDTLDLDKSVTTPGAQGGTVTIPDLVGQLQASVETSATDAAASASAAAASAQTAHDISNIDTSDDVVSTLVADPQTGPKTTAALNAAIGSVATDPAGTVVEFNDNRYPAVATSASRSAGDIIACYGDSLTESGQGGGSTWEQYLAALRPDLTFVNRGVSGEESGAVAVRQGGIHLTATEAFTIPAGSTNPLTVLVSTDRMTNLNTNSHTGVTIGGVTGTLAVNDNIVAPAGPLTHANGTTGDARIWTFTPDATPEASVNVAAGDQFMFPTAEPDAMSTQILWVGRNDVAFGYPQVVAGTLDAVAGMTSHLAGAVDVPRFLVVSVIATAQYDDPDQGGNVLNRPWIDAINAGLRDAHGANYVDLHGYLVNNATSIAAAAGITLSADDTTAIAAGYIPTSFTVDGVHLNDAVRQHGVAPCLADALASIRQGQRIGPPARLTVPLSAGWTPVDADSALEVTAKNDIAYLNGTLGGGTTTEGTVIAIIPEGYRPPKPIRFGVTVDNSGNYTPAASTITIDAAGEVIIGANVSNLSLIIAAVYPLW